MKKISLLILSNLLLTGVVFCQEDFFNLSGGSLLRKNISNHNLQINSEPNFYEICSDGYGLLQDTISGYKKKNFSIGVHIGFGHGFNTGTFSNYYKSVIFTAAAGIDFSYKRSVISFDITSCRHDNVKIYTGPKTFEESAGTDIINASFGYSIIDNSRFEVTPFAGIAHIGFSTYNSANEFLTENDNNIIIGISGGYKYKEKMKLASNSKIPVSRLKESSIQARILVTKLNFYDDLSGYMVNISFVIPWKFNKIVPE